MEGEVSGTTLARGCVAIVSIAMVALAVNSGLSRSRADPAANPESRGTSALASNTDASVARYVVAVQADLDPREQQALARIDGLDRRLLALRAYLRNRAPVDQRWSWSQQDIDRYPGSPLQVALDAEITKVRSAFERENAGYTLWVNPEVRSLDLQLQRWNENPSVGQAAQSLLADVRQTIAASALPGAGTPEGRQAFVRLLVGLTPHPAPPLAAPGLSAHGRMQAVDFQVREGEKTVAGTGTDEVEPVWLAQGWRDRLQRAVADSSKCFSGPLVVPVEPWHYEYRC